MATFKIKGKTYHLKNGSFYGSKIKTGTLHKKMGVKPNHKISLTEINSQLFKLKAKKNKTAADVKKERELVFAKNAKTKFH